MAFKSEPPEMKKYYQLALVILAVLSVTAFVFYKNEYDKLHKVLEVLDIFGKKPPGYEESTGDDAQNCSELLPAAFHELQNPAPSWQRITDSWFAYSAFWVETGGLEETNVKALVVGDAGEAVSLTCYLWYDTKDEPVEGKAYYFPIDKSEVEIAQGVIPQPDLAKYKTYFCFCRADKTKGVPYAVNFVPLEERHEDYTPIPVHRVSKKDQSGKTAVCVLPFTKSKMSVTPSQVVEFLTFHHVVGVNHILFYDGSIPNNARKVLLDAFKFGYVSQVYPWNFPFGKNLQELASSIVTQDCIHRLLGHADDVAVITVEDFMVPRHHHALGLVYVDYESNWKDISEFHFPVLDFCLEFPSGKVGDSPPVWKGVIPYKSRYMKSSEKKRVVAYRPSVILGNAKAVSSYKQQFVSKEIASVHSYVRCGKDREDSEKTSSDFTMLKFVDAIGGSPYLKKWIHVF